MKVLVYSILGFDKAFLEKAAQGNHELVFTEEPLNESTANLANGFDVVSLFTSDVASEKVLQILHTCGVKYIALRSVGYDHVDLAQAKFLAMKVANVPEYSPYAIAELAVALLLALNRKLVFGQTLMQMGDYRLDNLVGFDLHGKTIGIVGTGKIGGAFAKIMHGFGCKIVAFDIKENIELKNEIPITYVSLEDLCATADVISVHYPLNDTTRHLFNKSTFALMRKEVIFINTARGEIVNTRDLLEAIENETIGAAGLDVYEKEKPIFFQDHTNSQINDDLFLKLRSHRNVLITGHQGFLTNEALAGIAHTTIANLNAWASKDICENEVN